MKSITAIVGILLILFGVGSFILQGINYSKQEKVAQLGNVEVSAERDKTLIIPPIYSGLAVIAGVVVIVVGRFL